MSLPIYRIECTNCEHTSGFSTNTWYEFEGGRQALCRPSITIEWCKDCQKIGVACGPQSDDSLKETVDELNRSIGVEEEKRKKWWRILLRKNADEQAISDWKEKIGALRDCIDLFKKSGVVKKCMTCGSTNLVPINLPDGFSKHGPAPIGVTHECGGELMAESNMRVSLNHFPKVIYNFKCEVICDERPSKPEDYY